MKLFLKILFVIFTMIATIWEMYSPTVVNILQKKTSLSVLPYAYTNTPINKCNPNDWYWHKGAAQLVSFTLNNASVWITLFKARIVQQTSLLKFTHTTVGALTYTMTSSFLGGMATNGLTANMAQGVAAQGGTNLTPKIVKQMGSRGWSEGLVNSTVKNPYTTRVATNKATGNAATAFFTKEGAYVVKDNVTGQIIQISNRLAPRWIPDATIINPYIPK